MKLVDILARDLKEWPDCYMDGETEAVAQDSGGELNSLDHGRKADVAQMMGTYWSSIQWSLTGIVFEEAEDYRTAIVTCSQWQAAVDALKVGEQAWDGEGLPPVGKVCEIRGTVGQELRKQASTWAKVEIIAHTCFGGEPIAVGVDVSEATLGWGIAHMFRPIRSAEQIVADEKQDAWLAGIAAEYDQETADNCAAVLVAGGYRKQVQQ